MCIGLCSRLLLLRAVKALEVAQSYTTCAHNLHMQNYSDRERKYATETMHHAAHDRSNNEKT
jgi:hypothetical protein